MLPALGHRMAELNEAIANMGVELAKARGQIKRLTKAKNDEHPPEYDNAMEVAEYWRERCMPGARELNGQRLRNTIDRLKAGASVDELKMSIDGYAARPNTSKKGRHPASVGGVFRADLELIMRTEENVQTGIQIAIAEMAHDQGIRNGGGSRYVAQLCGCGHALVAHQLFYLTGGTACAEKECACKEFDSLPVESEQWLHQQGYYARQREAQDQGRLL